MNQEILKNILKQVEQEGSQLATVFDLDSTLFCTTHRMVEIINQSIQTDDFKKNFAEDLEEIKKFKIDLKDWSIQDIFKKQGFETNHPAVRFIHKIWRELFFTSEYLHYDKPYKGSVEFLNQLKERGAEIFYLTARSQNKMKEGTFESIKKWKFPLKTNEHLILKTNSETEDAIYKQAKLEEICKKFKTVFFFENEPVILNLVQNKLPQVKLFWIDSSHSQKQTPPKEAQILSPNYSIS